MHCEARVYRLTKKSDSDILPKPGAQSAKFCKDGGCSLKANAKTPVGRHKKAGVGNVRPRHVGRSQSLTTKRRERCGDGKRQTAVAFGIGMHALAFARIGKEFRIELR